MKELTKTEKSALKKARFGIGYYSISELQAMFSDCGRSKIDYLINSGELSSISPNNRERYVKLEDFLSCLQKEKELSTQFTNSKAPYITKDNVLPQ